MSVILIGEAYQILNTITDNQHKHELLEYVNKELDCFRRESQTVTNINNLNSSIISMDYEMLNQTFLKTVINDQHQLSSSEQLVSRELYEKIEPLLKNKQVLILSGIRRCGKSTLLSFIRSHNAEKEYWINCIDIDC